MSSKVQIVEKSTHNQLGALLEAYENPAILVSADYTILYTNQLYQKQFGKIDLTERPNCYRVSHGYDVPCDRAGESCPLVAAKTSGNKEQVLHIHQTPRGKEHVDVEMIPIFNEQNEIDYFVEVLKPVPLASGAVSRKKMVGQSEQFNFLIERIARVGKTDTAVLLLGESGTGKELAAKAIHLASQRKDKPLVTLECSGLTDSLFESELFGHKKGSFTGAYADKKGLIELAEGGTLFLDEIADVPLNIQVKLLRLLESHTYRPVGSSETRSADFRLICATHKNISQLVEEGEFRQDLYYRINVFPICLPALRERPSDIPLIAKHLLKEIEPAKDYYLTNEAVKSLCRYPFKGNVRELRNILMRAIVYTDTNMIDHHIIDLCLEDIGNNGAAELAKRDLTNSSHFSNASNNPAERVQHSEMTLKDNEKKYLASLMREHNGNKQSVADTAGISLRSLYRKLEQFAIE